MIKDGKRKLNLNSNNKIIDTKPLKIDNNNILIKFS